jgi:hypothetical protein
MTVVEVSETEYAKQYLWALNYAVERLDVVLDERSPVESDEGFADVIAEIEDYAIELRAKPGWARELLTRRLAEIMAAKPATTVLTKYAVRDLIERMVNSAHCDAFEDAALRGRQCLAALPTEQMASASEAIGYLETLAAAGRQDDPPAAMKFGTRLAAQWFDSLDQPQPARRKTGPAAVPKRTLSDEEIGELVEVGLAVTAGSEPPRDKIIAEYPASFCPPIGKTLAIGHVAVLEDKFGRRGAVFMADQRAPDGSPIGELLHIAIGAKAKMGGRIDLDGGYYVIIGGGKSAAKQVLRQLGL